ncbi:MAG: hypothetical protein GY832_18400 [Chloroflexi bacterium]|nr:hypothetical protein [Chloroflexota bacterium]
MKTKSQLVNTIMLVLGVGLFLGASTLLAGCNSQQEHTPPVTPNSTVPQTTTRALTPTASATPAPTPTLTKREKAAAAVGQEYSNYSPTRTECEQAFESGKVKACVWPDSIQLIVRPEWKQLFLDTSFYVIGLTGRYQEPEHDYYRRTRLVAWQDDQCYTADTFNELLKVNDVVITAENRELVAKALVLMTLPNHIEDDVAFYDWRREDGPWAAAKGSSDYWYYNYRITVWTKIQGLESTWWFLFLEEDQEIRLRNATAGLLEYGVGDYTDISYEIVPFPDVSRTYGFWGK